MNRLRRFVPIVAIYAAGLLSGAAFSAAAVSTQYPFERLEVFAEALSIIHARYVDERDADELLYDAVSGLCRNLDNHSIFMEPEAYREMKEETSGEYFGIGVVLDLKDGRLHVVRTIEGSPAEQVGMLAGDEILAVDGEVVALLSLELALARIEGKRGSQVQLRIAREGVVVPLELVVRRDQVRTSSVESARIDQHIGWLKIERFQRRTVDEVRVELRELTASGAALTGLVLDLRGNPGGYLSQAVSVADIWLDQGPIVSTLDRVEGTQRDMARTLGTDSDTELVVLIDRGTASAAEIVAGALQDRARAKVVGQSSYGKGSVQQFFELSDGSALKLTTARYYTPSGRSIQGVGVRPDIVINDQLPAQDSSTLDRLLRGTSSDPAWVRNDRVLHLAALTLRDSETVEEWWDSSLSARQKDN
jgi:carboxyl-terminal processing protease